MLFFQISYSLPFFWTSILHNLNRKRAYMIIWFWGAVRSPGLVWPVGAGWLGSLKRVSPWTLWGCPPQRAFAELLSLGLVRRYFLLTEASSQPLLVLPLLWSLASEAPWLSWRSLCNATVKFTGWTSRNLKGWGWGMSKQVNKGGPDLRSLSDCNIPTLGSCKDFD